MLTRSLRSAGCRRLGEGETVSGDRAVVACRNHPNSPALRRLGRGTEVGQDGRRMIRARTGLFSSGVARLTAIVMVQVPFLTIVSGSVAQDAEAVVATESPPMADGIPAEVKAVYFSNGSKTAAAGASPSATALAALVIAEAQQLGLLSTLDQTQRIWLDAFALVALAREHPYAMMLFDAHARPRADGGHNLSGLIGAMVVRTMGEHAAIEAKIQRVLNTYTNDVDSQLVTTQRDGRMHFTVSDRRWPEWLEFSWGSLGDDYVLAIGPGAFKHVRRAHADKSLTLSNDAWFESAMARMSDMPRAHGLYIRFDRLVNNATSPLGKKIRAAQTGLGLGGVGRALWAIGKADRSVEIAGVFQHGDRDDVVRIAGDRVWLEGLRRPIPTDATVYAIVPGEPVALVRSIIDGYLSSRSAGAVDKSRAFWGSIVARSGVSFDRDLASLLRGPIVIHDFPKPVLPLPLARTIVVRIDGDPKVFRERLDKWMSAYDAALASEGGVRLHRSDDGVWYTRWGLAGPAVVAADGWLIVGYSAQAVRLNRDWLGEKKGRRDGGKKRDEGSEGP